MTTRYTRDHEWIRLDGDIAVVGITDYAQEQLGDIVYVELPAAGKTVEKGGEFCVVEFGQGRERGLRPDIGRGDRGERRARRPARRGERVARRDGLADQDEAGEQGRRRRPDGCGRLRRLPQDDLTLMAEHLYKATVAWRRGEGEFAQGPLLPRPYVAFRRWHRGAGLGLAAGGAEAVCGRGGGRPGGGVHRLALLVPHADLPRSRAPRRVRRRRPMRTRRRA